MRRFKRFVGIDWSGARNARGSIQVAALLPNEPHPRIVPPSNAYWSRSAVLDYIRSLEDRTIVGIDFAFSVPWPEGQGPWPKYDGQVTHIRDLWAKVDDLCATEADFFAGPVWLSQDSPFRPFIRHSRTGQVGSLYDRNRFRKTERLASRRPISVYHMAGAQVGQASFAGMRFLHALCDKDSDVAVWPFDPVGGARIIILEVYPSLFYSQAGGRRPRKKDNDRVFFENVRRALAHFGFQDGHRECRRSVDKADAIVAAAAISSIAKHSAAFALPGRCSSVAMREGWIFGVLFGGNP